MLPGMMPVVGNLGAASEGDEYTSLLLHFDGADGSTDYPDTSHTPKMITGVGNAQIDTAQSKFGGASLLLDGSGDYLNGPNDAAFSFGSTEDFCVDMWLRPSNLSGSRYITSQTNGFTLYVSSGFMTAGVGAFGYTFFSHGMSTGNWYHVAVTRASGTLRVFIGGVQKATATVTVALPNDTLKIGADPSNANTWAGHIDEFRWSKGVARWTAGFTPPASAYT